MAITDPLIGCQLGDYRILDMLGRGGMARVYRGYDEKLDRYAAVKVIDASQAVEPVEEYRQRFLREARAIARLNHPNIVGVYQFGENGSTYYMAMAFIEGRDLGQILWAYEREGRLMPYRDVLRLMRDLAAALDHAHAGGVIHRDIKPSNIMVTPDGHAVLTDFGLALSVPEGSMGNSFGSAHYIAPEQAVSSASAVPQSDFYSLGVVLYLMLTGRVPFDDPSAMAVVLQHLNDTPPAPRTVNPRLPSQVEAVVLRMLEKDPAQRFPDGAAIIKALEQAFQAAGDNTELRRPSELIKAVAAQASPKPAPRTRSTLSRTSAVVMERRPVKQRRFALVVSLVLLALLLLGTGAMLIVASLTSDPPVPTAMAGDFLTHAPASDLSVSVITEVTADPTEKLPPATVAEGMEATSVPPSDTSVPANTTPTETATSTSTPSVTASPTPADTPMAITPVIAVAVTEEPPTGPHIDLRFDESSLVIYNPEESAVDISNLHFVQVTETGQLSFRSSQWYSAELLEPKACVQVWTNRFSELPLPDYCQFRQAWRAVSFLRWFWLSDNPDASFEVRRGDRVLARCPIKNGACAVNVG